MKRGLFGRTIAAIARTRAKISETKLQTATLEANAQSEILNERKAIEGELPSSPSACLRLLHTTTSSTSAPATAA